MTTRRVSLVLAVLLPMAIWSSVRAQTAEDCDFDRSGTVDFGDFVLFAQAFGAQEGQEGYLSAFDLDGSGRVDFPDFATFAGLFGERALLMKMV